MHVQSFVLQDTDHTHSHTQITVVHQVMQNKSEKYSAVYSRFCLRARLSKAGARTPLYGNDFRRMSGAGERDKRERNHKSGLTPDKTKRPSVEGARLGPAPPLGPAGGGHDDAESAADRFG